MYLASILQQEDIDVEIFDVRGKAYSERQVQERLDRVDYDVLGIGGMTTIYYYIKQISKYVKEKQPNIPIMVGGSAVSPIPEHVLTNTHADVACINEGEEIIVNLVKALVSKADLQDISGIAFKRNGKIIHTKKRGRVRDLDALLYPAYDLVDMERIYIKNSKIRPSLLRYLTKRGCKSETVSNSVGIITERGCPFRCTFCYRNYGRKVFKHSVRYVVEHMNYLNSKYGVNNFIFHDEVFNIHKKWVMEFCEKVIRDNLNYYLSAVNGNRANTFDRETMQAMVEAGFYEIGIGVESYYQPILNEMKKDVKVQKLIDTLKLTIELGVEMSPLLLFGFPSDTKESLRVSVDCTKKLDFVSGFYIPCPYPGTELFNYAIEKNLINDVDAFLLELADKDANQLIVNFTKFSDKELIAMKTSAEYEILDSYNRRHRLGYYEFTLYNVLRYLCHKIIPQKYVERLKCGKWFQWLK